MFQGGGFWCRMLCWAGLGTGERGPQGIVAWFMVQSLCMCAYCAFGFAGGQRSCDHDHDLASRNQLFVTLSSRMFEEDLCESRVPSGDRLARRFVLFLSFLAGTFQLCHLPFLSSFAARDVVLSI